MNGLIAFSLSFLLVYLIGNIAIAGQFFIIPFLIALIIAYCIIAFAEWIKKLIHLPMSLAYLAAIAGIIMGVYAVSTIVTDNVQSLIELAPIYQQKLEGIIDVIFNFFHLSEPNLKEIFGQFNFSSIVGSIVVMIRDVASSAGMIALYVIFIMIEYHYFHDKLTALISSQENFESVEKILSKIATKTKSYLILKTFLSIVTSSLSYALMIVVGVDFAEFWALLIFLLNFIPTIGSIVATAFPCMLTFLQFEKLFPFIIITVGLVSLQFIIGNVIEPRLMGKQFNLSGLVILLSLTISGAIWGVIGMFLCVPILMMTSIILANFSKTRPIAIFLSQDGTLLD